MANETSYVLSAAVFTRDVERGNRFAHRMQAGMTHVNDLPFNDLPNCPFGVKRTAVLGDTTAGGRSRSSPRCIGSPSSTNPCRIRSDVTVAPARRTATRQGAPRMPTNMWAAALDRFGGPEVPTLRVVPVPALDASEVLIALHTAGVGSWDADMRDGWWPDSERPGFPLVRGTDGSGTIAAVGSRVRRFTPGSARSCCACATGSQAWPAARHSVWPWAHSELNAREEPMGRERYSPSRFSSRRTPRRCSNTATVRRVPPRR